jgi:hypothetical protein
MAMVPAICGIPMIAVVVAVGVAAAPVLLEVQGRWLVAMVGHHRL